MRTLEPVVFCCDSAVGTEAADISVLLQTIAGTCRQVRQLSWTVHYTTDLNFASALAAVLTTSTCMPRVLPETLACCRRLTWLEVECYSLFNSQMLPLVVSAHRLECCSVPGSTDLTYACLAALSENCRDLSWLHVNSSALLMEGALLQLPQRYPKLSELDVHPRSMSAATVAALHIGNRASTELSRKRNVI
jgi:hypothetical protein